MHYIETIGAVSLVMIMSIALMYTVNMLFEARKLVDSLKTLLADTHKLIADIHAESAEERTSYEIERERRENLFDARIQELRGELAKDAPLYAPQTVAEEIHPLVKNIPHDESKEKPRTPMLEIAE